MRKGGYVALEAVGMVITVLAAQAMIRALLNPDSEPLWGILNGVPGGLTGQMIVLGFIALVAMVSGGWAHTRKEPTAERPGNSGGIRDRGTT
ncbi:hypothetical protein M271_25990 [Streptomyces rapamycinicus NRRL 5491]|uniref:Uncharacterized protein n=2 Tax=Streptomyces rapamycinicus TaxID=1226757 RepID=A0A0A0NHH2_STRRN|nr:hypothetical protein M271_25990 [Streptomyces rapamycinicus NRRL 5491]RLV80228.1 hypothetical protein D3C57_117625 [Streptomyces rapamycinicus NRRL 5491]